MDPQQQNQQGQYPQPQQPMPQQQPYQQQPGQQPMYPQQVFPQGQDGYQPVQKQPGINVKLLVMIVGGFLGLVLILTVVASIAGGGSDGNSTSNVESSVELRTFTNASTPFEVQVPVAWSVEPIEIENYSYISLSPEGAAIDDPSEIVIGRDQNVREASQFISDTETVVSNLQSAGFDALRGFSVANVSSENYGSTDAPAFKVTYSRSADGEQNANVEAYYIFQEDGTAVNATFTYSEQYADIEGAVTAILTSYTPRD